jgi:HSP90 family molecular chaperone
LADELYDSSTHFLEEILQNADDNEYTSDPTLSFKYTPGFLQIDSNETGFTAANVEAICAVRNSTKSGKNSSERWTGEKGIGFKSVFKVADEVTIFSGPYSFKFDKKQRFGMINPIWIDREGDVPLNKTSIVLKLSDDYSAQELVDELQRFDAHCLLFLR